MSELDPEARRLIDLARPSEGATFADRARVRRRLSAALGAGALGVAAGREVLDSGIQTSSTPIPEGAAHGVLERISGEVLRVAPVAKTATLLAGAPALAVQAAALLLGGALVGGSAWFVTRVAVEVSAPSAALTAPVPAAVAADAQGVASRPQAKTDTGAASKASEKRSPEALVPQPEPLNAAPSSAEPPTEVDGLPPIQPEDLPVLEAPLSSKVSRSGARSSANTAAKRNAATPAAARRAGTSLAEEARQLAAVHEALREGNHALALTRLEAMERRPGGVLGEERLVARVLSLCGLGRASEAQGIARRVESVAPESPLLPRLDASCASGALSGIRRGP